MANIFCALKNRFSMHISIPTKSFLQSVFSYSIFIFLIMIVDQVNWNVDNLLLGIMKGTAAVSIYGVGSQFNSFFKSLSTSISSMMTPRIHKIQNMTCDIIEKNRKFTDLLISTGRIQFAVIMLAYTGLLFVGKSFILRWVGEQYEQSYYVVLCILGCEIIPLIENTATEIRRAKDMQKIPTVVSVVRAVLNVLISIPLCEKYGPVGCALGTTITMTMGVIFLNFYYELYMKLNMIRFWKEIGRLSLGLIVPFIFAIIARCKFEIITFEQIALFSVIYTIIYMMSMYFFGIYAQERKYIQEKIVMYIGKLKQLVEGI
jgi:O-antigen/teichoic acid export membrane protein